MNILDGKKTSDLIKKELHAEVEKMLEKGYRKPHLAAVLVGNNGASLTYVNAKVKACEESNFDSSVIKLPENISESDLLLEIGKLNKSEKIDGFIVQLPLPKHINSEKVLDFISPKKDVDGFHPENFGRVALGLPAFLPATPYGIMMLLEKNNIPTSGKNCVIIGRSNIVGLPMTLLMNKPGDATVTLTHKLTKNLEFHTKNADIIIVAVGIPKFLKVEMIKDGAVIVDVGITRVEDKNNPKGYAIIGDVDFENVAPKCSWITPVPGGVGPMTIAGLLKNTFKAAYQK